MAKDGREDFDRAISEAVVETRKAGEGRVSIDEEHQEYSLVPKILVPILTILAPSSIAIL